jgi:molybdate transport system regulatory protein
MTPPRLRLRIDFGPDRRMGPGKADLLQAIHETGSIAAAGRRMGMSYRRAWQLVGTMTAMFGAPVVDSARGGAKGGGARLTAKGEGVLAAFRALEMALETRAADELAVLQKLISDIPDRK